MTSCEMCNKMAPQEINNMLNESNYSGEYFCSDECRNTYRLKEENFGGFK